MRRSRSRRLAAVAILSLATCVACGPESPPPPPGPAAEAPADSEAAPELPPAPAGPALEAPQPDAKISGPEQPPSGLSDDVPLYEPATPRGSMASPTRGTVIHLETADAGDAVFEWYRDQLEQRGWRLDRQDAAGTQHLLTATKDGRKLTVMIRSLVQGSTTVLITVAQES